MTSAAAKTVPDKTVVPHHTSDDVWSLWLVPVLLLAAGVRILGLGNTDLWGDEAFSVVTSRGPLSQLFGLLARSEPHPPLYPLVLAGWLRLFGDSELVARLPSAVAGIAGVAVAAALARAFAPARAPAQATIAAVVAGLLVALNPFQVWYSQEARMYAQVSFFAGLATLALLRLWRGQRYATALYVGALLGAGGSHYYGLFVPLVHGVVVGLSAREQRAAVGRWLRATTIAAVLYLPWVFVAVRIFTSFSNGPAGYEDLPAVLVSSWARIAAGWSLEWPDAVRTAAIVSALAVLGALVPARSADDRFLRSVLIAWLLVPPTAGYALSLFRPSLNERYLIVSSLPLILLVARGITWVGTRGWVLGARDRTSPVAGGALAPSTQPLVPIFMTAVGVAGLGLALYLALPPLQSVWAGGYLKSAYSVHTRTVAQLARPTDAVILDGYAQTQLYEYYARKDLPFVTLPRQNPMDPNDTLAELSRVSQQYPGAWVIWYASPLYDPQNLIGRWLARHAYHSFDDYATNARLQYYRFAADASLAVRETSIQFGDAIELTRYGWADVPLAAGDTIPVDLRWQRLAGTLSRPQAALRLVDGTGFTWSQTDDAIGAGFVEDGSWQSGGTIDDRHGLLVPAGTPPGDYRLLLNVYGAEHPQALPLSGTGAALTPGGVLLATVHVAQSSQVIWTRGIAGFIPSTATWRSGIALLGSVSSQSAAAGQSGNLTLVWKALASALPVAKLRVRLTAADGKVAEDLVLPLATSAYPAARWQAGDVLREQYRLPIGDQLDAGQYQVSVEPVSQSGDPVGNAAPAVIGYVNVTPGAAMSPVAPPRIPLSYQLGSGIVLDGIDLSGTPLQPGDTFRATLHWRDLAPVDVDYTVFVHILDASEKVVAQHDQPPAAGARPTSSWFAGDVIFDTYTIQLPKSLTPGDYPIEVGMYNASTGERLPVAHNGATDGDRIIVATLRVS
jgi:4-amino-4-deoxy-L-arabinose transferase-like glycosyltransferase